MSSVEECGQFCGSGFLNLSSFADFLVLGNPGFEENHDFFAIR